MDENRPHADERRFRQAAVSRLTRHRTAGAVRLLQVYRVRAMSGYQVAAGALVTVLKSVLPVVQRKTSIPILQHVLLAASEEGLSVSATDLDMQMDATCQLVAPPKSPVRFTVDPRAVLAATVNLPRDWPVTVDLRDGAAIVAWEWGEMRLLTLRASDFPAMKAGEALAGFDVPEGGLKPLDDVRPCISTEETRYYLNGVYLDRGPNDDILLVATDGHRLAAARTGWQAPDGDKDAFKVIAHKRFCDVWSQHFRREAHRFEFIAGQAVNSTPYTRVKGERLTVTAKPIEGTFPEWRRVVPKNRERAVVVSRNAILQGLHTAARFCGAVLRARSKSTTFHVDGGRAYLHCRSAERETLRLDIGAARGPDGFYFGVNAPYLIHATARMEGEEVTLAQGGEGEPVLLASEAVDFVVMPLRIEFVPAAQTKKAA